MQITAGMRSGMLGVWTGTGGPLDPAATFLGLYVARAASGLGTQLSDLTLPPGALAVAVALDAYGTAYLLADGSLVRDATVQEFRPADADNGFLAMGWYLSTADEDGQLLAYQDFPEPIPLPDENSALSLIFRPKLDPVQSFESTITIDG